MSTVGPDDVRRVAALARLRLSDERIVELAAQLDGILAHMEVLRSAPIQSLGSGATAAVDGMPLRDDGGPPIPLATPIAEFAPVTREGFFLVPRLASHGSEVEERGS